MIIQIFILLIHIFLCFWIHFFQLGQDPYPDIRILSLESCQIIQNCIVHEMEVTFVHQMSGIYQIILYPGYIFIIRIMLFTIYFKLFTVCSYPLIFGSVIKSQHLAVQRDFVMSDSWSEITHHCPPILCCVSVFSRIFFSFLEFRLAL